jgi:hypothetical protein
MNKNDIDEIWEAAGGKKGFIRWMKSSAKNLAQAYSGRSVLHGDGGGVQHAARDPEATKAEFMSLVTQTLQGIVAARQRERDGYGKPAPAVMTCILDDGSIGVIRGDVTNAGAANTDVTNRPGVSEHDIPHTRRTIQEVPAGVAQLHSPVKAEANFRLPDDGKAKPVKPATSRNEPTIPGLNAGALLDVNGPSQPDFGRNFSQNIASRYWSGS